MIRLRSFAKINLWFEMLGRRPDGYHEVRTILQTIDLSDQLIFEPSNDLDLEVTPPVVPAGPENLIWRAAEALARKVGVSCGARIRLIKSIPVGAGLGGGSSNAAVALLALNQLWQLALDATELHQLARSLGADVPFFLMGGTALGTGRGDELCPLPDPATRLELLILYPGFELSTRSAYALLDRDESGPVEPYRFQRLCMALAEGNLPYPALFNSFEAPLFRNYPVLAEIRDRLLGAGALAAHISGSGSSLFGIFASAGAAGQASKALAGQGWRLRRARSLNRRDYRQRLWRALKR